MKKAFSLLLVLVICLGMCACDNNADTNDNANTNSKFVGTYISGGDLFIKQGSHTIIKSTNTTMILHPNGIGSIEETLGENYESDSIGTVVKKYDITWQCDETYITITTTLTYDKYNSNNVGRSTTATYELKGTELFLPSESFSRWTKKS